MKRVQLISVYYWELKGILYSYSYSYNTDVFWSSFKDIELPNIFNKNININSIHYHYILLDNFNYKVNKILDLFSTLDLLN